VVGRLAFHFSFDFLYLVETRGVGNFQFISSHLKDRVIDSRSAREKACCALWFTWTTPFHYYDLNKYI